jgi:hypothetical protein
MGGLESLDYVDFEPNGACKTKNVILFLFTMLAEIIYNLHAMKYTPPPAPVPTQKNQRRDERKIASELSQILKIILHMFLINHFVIL